MNQVSSGKARDADGQVNTRQRTGRLLLVGTVTLMLAGCFNVTSSVFAQDQDIASCDKQCMALHCKPGATADGSPNDGCNYAYSVCHSNCAGGGD